MGKYRDWFLHGSIGQRPVDAPNEHNTFRGWAAPERKVYDTSDRWNSMRARHVRQLSSHDKRHLYDKRSKHRYKRF